MLVLLGTAFFMTILDGTSLLTALPAIEREFRAHGTAVQWAVTAYALAFAGLLLLCGRAADLLGRRRVFLAGMSLRVLASLGCGFAPTVEALVAARALQGVSAAIIAPAALSMVMNAFAEGSERNRALGIWGGIGGFGATAGLLLGGLTPRMHPRLGSPRRRRCFRVIRPRSAWSASSRHWAWSSLWPCSASDRHRSPKRPRRLPLTRPHSRLTH
ncbi:MFS transporter [Streptosporangium soli]|nr:MFS transporter [Streptosporangium sp. KLBMP 9127]